MLFMFFIMMVMVLLCCAAPFASATWLLMLDLHTYLGSYICLRASTKEFRDRDHVHTFNMYVSTYVCVHHCVRANASNLCTSTIDCTYDYDS